MTDPIPAEAVRLALAARRRALTDDPTPTHLSDERLTEMMLEAAAPILAEHYKTPAVRLLKEALFLRTNGEYAPGGRENWHDWDRKAEVFLRSLLPPEREDEGRGR